MIVKLVHGLLGNWRLPFKALVFDLLFYYGCIVPLTNVFRHSTSMESDGGIIIDDVLSDEEISDEYLQMEMDPPEALSNHEHRDDDFQYEALSADQIVQHMVDTIREVNAVVQVSLLCII